jgi:hypothetical protein
MNKKILYAGVTYPKMKPTVNSESVYGYEKSTSSLTSATFFLISNQQISLKA